MDTQEMNPLHGYELSFLRQGGCLIRHARRYPLILMWARKKVPPAETWHPHQEI